MNLKRCPCGKVPTDVDVDDSPGSKWNYVYGNCCASWAVEFRTYYHERTTPELKELAIEAWNGAERGFD